MKEIATTIDLSDRKNDGMTIILWWVKDTRDTYVTVDDSREGNYHIIPTPEGVSANDVFYRPFSYPEMAKPAMEDNVILGQE